MKKAFEFLMTAVICSGLVFVLNSTAAATETVIVSNQNHYISYEITGAETVVFKMQAINDFTDELTGKFPQADFFSIAIDANQNGAIDEGIDFSYGKPNEQAGICVNYLISHNSSRPCGSFKSKAYLEINLARQKLNQKRIRFINS